MTDRADDCEFVSNGTVRIFVDGKEYKLRRPKVGEMKERRRALWETQDKIDALLQGESDKPKGKTRKKAGVAEQVQDLADDVASGDEAKVDGMLAKARDIRTITRSLTEQTEEFYGDWIEETVKSLGDHNLPTLRDEWPLFLTDVTFITELIGHWRTVPLGPSRSSK